MPWIRIPVADKPRLPRSRHTAFMSSPRQGLPPEPSSRMSVVVRWIFRRQLRKNFHQVRVAKESFAAQELPADQPVVAFGNHPSWWDPLVTVAAERYYFPGRFSYAPIDAVMLEKYGIFKSVGFFGVDRDGGTRGAVEFLKIASGLLERSRSLLWMTPQGRFSDPRERPVEFERGIAHLARRVPEAHYIPMAVELAFWEESKPEVLTYLGPPVKFDPKAEVGEILASLESGMEAAMDRLAELSIARQADAFVPAMDGASGVGGIYDLWRSFRQMARGKKPSLNHSDL